jgi:hypothetical protein
VGGHRHAPPEQIVLPVQTVVQLPQWLGSVRVSTQLPPQRVWSAGQALVQMPLTQL